MAPRIELHIEELVLHGFDPGERYAFAEALQTRLAEVLAERGLPYAWTDGTNVERIDAGEVHRRHGTAPATVGAAVAGAIDRAVRAE